ncbi:hypothetical protein ACFO25_08565 [Paenactinomyces guangxiensis]|uniref:Uncharacterized protein n=1 Tax=Paenactinomyces guangxiensis TaxID=1490290 RepID=A0A7W2A793_9BACL|nr:hypothetical protein [Paenactinomyces guangxiensis]MBA4492902.1 hypothetical protein [Paenactinomyces guangxiensis]MBH8590249.1 hypothetical protein [Paenactinomyces guangxiensis]
MKKLFDELEAKGVKFSREASVGITRTPSGKITWLETGNSKAGLQHIMERHSKEFSSWGLNNQDEVANLILETVTTKNGVQQGGATIYDVVVGGKPRKLKVVISENGFIVTAHPFS